MATNGAAILAWYAGSLSSAWATLTLNSKYRSGTCGSGFCDFIRRHE